MKLERLDLATAKEILDFSGGDSNLEDLGKLQLRGAVALHNMIASPEVGMGYLADEVGMGKTYIALGVVSLMRYFNPTLRVLYICPSANVQEKWSEREYINFARSNVKVSHFRVRTIDGRPAAPKISCRNVHELIYSASLGYFSDFFVRNNLFSIKLGERSDNLGDKQDPWKTKLDELKDLLPAWVIRKNAKSKEDVKDQYAEALNYVLPTFDLVVIDEAHNFKHNFESSARNRVLSKMLGFRTDGSDTIRERVNHALLLSATPYDRDLEQLRNQLKLVGKGELLPEELPDDQSQKQKEIQNSLSKFMVRRFNTLEINHKPHTRNMYRHERRSGEGTEICLKSDEQKLVTALVQKKVLELLKKAPEDKKATKKGASVSFQTGMLASFESYADSTKSGAVEYDSDSPEKDNQGVEDRHIIGAISNSYKDAKLGTTLPHPKMDEISKQLNDIVFKEGKKHIVFVRRVKSVKELKHKLDDYYNQWIFDYMKDSLQGESTYAFSINKVIGKYKEVSRDRDDNISGGEYQEEESAEANSEGNNQTPNDTIFTWFFRGKTPKEAKECLDNFTSIESSESIKSPEKLREKLTDGQDARFLEVNWASAICSRLGLDLEKICEEYEEDIAGFAQKYAKGNTPFHASQFGFLEWCKEEKSLPGIEKSLPGIEKISNYFSSGEEAKLNVKKVVDNLKTWTLFDAMRKKALLAGLFPLLDEALDGDKKEGKDESLLRKLDVHVHLLSMCLRTGHGFIDLYISWLRQGSAGLVDDFTDRLKKQSQGKGFNTYQELSNLSQHLDLVIKTNLPDVYGIEKPKLNRLYFSDKLTSVVPVVGATGETSGRSAQARKFRMPGYPLILISTNVFQEGEDLHTFCDSVLHYGLSPSPVSIEQKTGRVDRVGSQAHRRLKPDTSPNKDQFIQVSFPFVRESIEALQVRQLCRNINEFIESFNDQSRQNTAKNDEVNVRNGMNDTSEIPELTQKLLKSPYDTDAPKLGGECRVEDVDKQNEAAEGIVANIDNLLRKHFGGEESILERRKVSLPGVNRELTVELRSARASGEMLLRAKCIASGEMLLRAKCIKAEEKELRDIIKHSWRTFHRVYAVKTAEDCFDFYHDAEILIGDEGDTTSDEIEMFFKRFSQDEHNPDEYKRPVSDRIIGYWKKANEARYGQWLAEIKPFENEQHLGLKFAFGDEKNQKKREHNVRVYETADRCIFVAQVADDKITKKLSKEQLVRFTWERNANIDIVEFMLDDKENLVGRAVHPIRGLDEKEFLYCAYTLAVEADRLEYLIGQSDEH